MTIERWKDTAELIALVAVIGSLIAVVYELRQTQAALRAQTYQERAIDAISTHFTLATNPGIAPPGFYTVDFDVDAMSASERESFLPLMYTIMIDADNEHYQYQNGFLDEGFYQNDTVATIVDFAPAWRKLGIREARPEFRIEVDRVLAEKTDKQ